MIRSDRGITRGGLIQISGYPKSSTISLPPYSIIHSNTAFFVQNLVISGHLTFPEAKETPTLFCESFQTRMSVEMGKISELPVPSNASESSMGNDMPAKRRAAPRSSRRIATKDPAEDDLHPKQPIKQESKPEKKKPPGPKPDRDRETVVTEHGYSIHPNGTPSLRIILI